MPDAARNLALFSVFLLVVSVAIWAKLLRGPLLQRLDGRRPANAGPAELAMQILVVAFGLSAIAAMLAVAEWIFA
jgi:hypothetical protein